MRIVGIDLPSEAAQSLFILVAKKDVVSHSVSGIMNADKQEQ